MKNPVRIGLIMLGGADWMGGAEYIRNMALAFGNLPVEERAPFELCVISGLPLEPQFLAQLKPLGIESFAIYADQNPPFFHRARWVIDRRFRHRPNTRFAQFVAKHRLDFVYPLTSSNHYNVGVTLPLGSSLDPCRWAGWIPDFQHRHMPKYFNEEEITKRETGISILAQEARTLVFSSESAAKDFREFFPGGSSRAEVLHFHTNPAAAWFESDPLAVQEQFHLPDDFLLVSNQFWQHKNHGTLFAALGILRARGLEPTVVCTGQTGDYRNKDYYDTLLRQIEETGIAPQVHLLGLIERTEQIQLMRRALAVVQPSLFEGWSTVVEDARALGKVVLASDLAVHWEQNPPGCRFFIRDSPESLADAIEALLPELAPGPNKESETAARAAAQDAMRGYGRRFLQIVERALAQ